MNSSSSSSSVTHAGIQLPLINNPGANGIANSNRMYHEPLDELTTLGLQLLDDLIGASADEQQQLNIPGRS